jgi:hypothetical protein
MSLDRTIPSGGIWTQSGPDTKLIQGPLECFLSEKNPVILLHLLEEVRSMEPQRLCWILGIASLSDLQLPGIWFLLLGPEVLDPHLWGRVCANTSQQ